MEWLNMMGSQTVRLWLAQSMVLFFLLGGVFLVAVGIGLMVNTTGTLRLFGRLNSWVSMRNATRPLEIPRDTRQVAQKYRYWLAAIFVAGGIYALVGLVAQFDRSAVIAMFGLKFLRADFAAWLVDGFRWVLVAGNLTAIVIGIMLAFFPAIVVAVETRGSRWYSERQLTKGSDKLNLELDTWLAVYPRLAGGIILLFALSLVGTFGMMLPKVW